MARNATADNPPVTTQIVDLANKVDGMHPGFRASHPNAPKALGTLATPDSFADEEYHGIDAFILVSKSGQRQAVRYLVVPEKLVHVTPDQAAKQSPDFLFDELTKRIARKPVVFHLKAQFASTKPVARLTSTG